MEEARQQVPGFFVTFGRLLPEEGGDLSLSEILSPQFQARVQSREVTPDDSYFFLLPQPQPHPDFLVSSFLAPSLVQPPFLSDIAGYHLLWEIA
jgi:hypothetical protein